jgi:catechol 2,3-dioxygenase-like lactoylglutathione lyase family enzyme
MARRTMEPEEKPIHKTHPRAANHVGVGVSDIGKAVRWYQEILGFTLLKGPMEVRADQGYRGEEVHDVLGPEFRAMLQAHMAAANGFGIELFQLLDPPHQRRERSLEYWKNGFFHICVTDPNIEELASRIASSAAKGQRFGGSTRPRTTIGSAIAKIRLATSSKFIPTTTKPYMAA